MENDRAILAWARGQERNLGIAFDRGGNSDLLRRHAPPTGSGPFPAGEPHLDHGERLGCPQAMKARCP
jgi:hypothetical protein